MALCCREHELGRKSHSVAHTRLLFLTFAIIKNKMMSSLRSARLGGRYVPYWIHCFRDLSARLFILESSLNFVFHLPQVSFCAFVGLLTFPTPSEEYTQSKDNKQV